MWLRVPASQKWTLAVTGNGFPSDHAALTMFLVVCVLFYSRLRGGALVVNALLVGTARVLAHVDSPLDIIAGFVFAAVAALLARWAAPRMVRQLTRPRS